MDIKHANHSIGQNTFHFVWKPKYNLRIFLHPITRKIAEDAIRKVAIKWEINIIELKVLPNHVHCFADIPSTMSVSSALQVLKGGSARIILKKCDRWKTFLSRGHKKVHLWSPGKFFRSVGSVNANVIENYIRNSQGEWNCNLNPR
jgi:putative transposase